MEIKQFKGQKQRIISRAEADESDSDIITKLEHINFDECYKQDIASGEGFLITDYAPIDKQTKGKTNGIFSPEYGSTWGDEDAFSDRYSCKCGKTVGTVFEGITCSKCGTVVEFKDEDISKTGWFELAFPVIHPIMYKRIQSIIGKDLIEILVPPKCDYNGDYIVDEKNPFMNIGILEFKKRFKEILDHYMTKKHRWKEKVEEYKLIMDNVDTVFTHHLPVYSLILRPVSIIGGQILHHTKVNTSFARMSQLIYHLNKILDADIEELKVLKLLDRIQALYMEIYKHAIDYIAKSKRSHIRAMLLGGRYNFTARNVIIPYNSKKRLDEIKLPYLCFLELFKPEIINIIASLGHPMNEAKNIWFNASMRFDPFVYSIMKSMIEDKNKPIYLLVNRNPSIHFYSILYMRVAEIDNVYHNKVLSIPLNILVLLGADFDGDVLNLISVKDSEIAKHLHVFNPINMLVDRTTGRFNKLMNFIKDQVITLSRFGKLGYRERDEEYLNKK